MSLLLWKYQILLVFTQEGFYMVGQVRAWKKRRRDGGLKEWKGYFAMVGLKEFSHIHGWVGSIA